METILLVIIVVVLAVALDVVRRRKASGNTDDAGENTQEETVSKPRKPVTTSAPAPTTRSAPAPVKAAATDAVCRNACGTGVFANAKTWGYQLQKVDIDAVANSPFDVMVIDYSKDGSDEQAFTTDELERMQVKPDGIRRLVLSYMSIGEAEGYRYYWDAAWKTNKPDWLLEENPDWPENYSVCYWDPGWQSLFYGGGNSYVDKLIDAGFDGVYLDKCDVFEDLLSRNNKAAQARPDLEGDMVAFVQRLSQYAKSRNPRFAFVMQNAEVLLEHEALREAIDGVAKEELLFGISGPEKPNPKDEITFSRRALDLARNSGRTVFVVEYLNDSAKIKAATATLDDYGYLSTISPKNRKLNTLNTDPILV